jgi:hypothetical protein
MASGFALCSNRKCPLGEMCLRYFLFRSDIREVTDEVMACEPDGDGECEHFLPVSRGDDMDDTNE